jgi:hypothetical protein
VAVYNLTTTDQQVASAGVDYTFVNSGSANALLSWGDSGNKGGDVVYAGESRNLRASAAVYARTPSGTSTLTVTAVESAPAAIVAMIDGGSA